MWWASNSTHDQITVAVPISAPTFVRSLALPIRIDRQGRHRVIGDLVEDGVRRCVSDAGLRCRSNLGGSASAFRALSSGRRAFADKAQFFRSATCRFGADLNRRLGVPASIDSDVNLVTLAEHWFGPGARSQSLSRRERRTQPRSRHSSQWRIVSRREWPQPRPRRSCGPASWRRRATFG